MFGVCRPWVWVRVCGATSGTAKPGTMLPVGTHNLLDVEVSEVVVRVPFLSCDSRECVGPCVRGDNP